jgi:hypothetical protein
MLKHAMLGLLFLAPLALVGCGDAAKAPATQAAMPPATNDAATLRANLDQLPPEDLQLADAQRFCAIETDKRLGSMGVPVKVLVKDQPVFLCCDSCRTKALAHADRTLARVEQLKKKAEAPGKEAGPTGGNKP